MTRATVPWSRYRACNPGSLPARRARTPVRIRHGGYTLIEVGLVLGLLAFIVLAVADFFANQLSLQQAVRRPGDAVRDVEAIIDASIRWREASFLQQWPNDSLNINIDTLEDDGYLVPLPFNRYSDCPGGCGEYQLLGWDVFDVPLPGGNLGDYTIDPVDAEGLVVRFNVAGGGDAHTIASRLPLGRVTAEIDPDADVFQVETRVLLESGYTDRFVRLRNEFRQMEFADGSGSGGHAGEIYGVNVISRGTLEQGDLGGPRIELGALGGVEIDPAGGRVEIDGVPVVECIRALSAGAPTPVGC